MTGVKTLLSFFLCGAVALPALAVDSSTSTVRTKRVRTRSNVEKAIRDVPKEFGNVIRQTKPNPRVQKPSASPLPPQAPDMPTPPLPQPEPPSKADRFLNGVAKVMTKSWRNNIFVWLPAISTDPNTGPTLGILPVLVLSDQHSKRIRHLVAPSYTYNDLFGQTGTFRYYYYPTETSQLYSVLSLSSRTNREAKLRYENPALNDGVYYLRTEGYMKINGSERFYGIGPDTRQGDESGYVSKDMTLRASFGLNFFEHWRTTFGQRVRRYETRTNIIPDKADTLVRFPSTQGLGTHTTIANEVRLLWDTRDAPITPSTGRSGELFFEKASRIMGSDVDYIRYGADGKRFINWSNPKNITVIHGNYDWANGRFVPFYESPSLGGRNSLRGFGERRFVDSGSLVFNIEHRYIFSSLSLMGIQTNFEVAPFFDIGTVFPRLADMQRQDFRPVYGMAFRAAVKPNVVGDVEVGYGKEGVAVFVDINYPF